MTIRKIFVPLFGRDHVENSLESATLLANRFGAHVEARYVRPPMADMVLGDVGFGYVSADVIDQIEREGRIAAAAARARFDSWRAGQTPPSPIEWLDEEGNAGSVVAHRGALADLILLQRAGEKETAIDEPFDAAVCGAGRLTMLVDRLLPPSFLDHVMIAWNGSVEAAHAVTQSLPFLAIAGRVSLFTAPEIGQDAADIDALIAYLALHGIAARPLAAPPEGAVAATMLESARQAEATLLVMGAYTHGRLRQMFFGGVTRHMLKTPGLPVLMTH